MKKRILRSLGAIILSAALCMGMTATAETTIQPMEDNSIAFSVKPEYRDEVLADPEGAFAYLHPAGVYITGVSKEDGGGMGILLVLSERGEQARQEAIETLSDDIRVSYVHQYTDAPFENVNTLSLSADTNTIHVGEKIAIRPDGEIRIYKAPYDEYSLSVELKDFDPDKEYTVEDFPQLPLERVHKFSYDNGSDYAFLLVLDEEHSEFFDIIRAADIMSRAPDILSTWLEPAEWYVGGAEFCIVSDSSVAQFTNLKKIYVFGMVGIANEDNEYILEGLAPGKVTVTYYDYGHYDGPYTAQMEITVLGNEPQTSDVSDSPQSDSSESNPSKSSNSQPDSQQTNDSQPSYSQSGNPRTKDAPPIAAVGLFVLAGGSGLWIALRKSKAAKNLY